MTRVEFDNKAVEWRQNKITLTQFFDWVNSNQVEAQVKPASEIKETENIMLSDLIKHLRFDFDEGEIISYRIKVKQPKSIREIRYPTK